MGAQCQAGNHVVGVIQNRLVRASDWPQEIDRLAAAVGDMNFRGQNLAQSLPGGAQRAQFCPACGANLQPPSMGEDGTKSSG
jgi:NADH pyrophosphatase NudC (nudix superfamily)